MKTGMASIIEDEVTQRFVRIIMMMMMILLMMVIMQVCGGGAEELEPDDEGQLPVRVHQLAVDSVLGGGLLVPLLPPPPRPPHHPAHRGQQIDSHITGVSAIHLTLLPITSAEECSAVQLLLFLQYACRYMC